MEDKIINLVGASGSGKTTIAKELEKLDYNIIHSYTNREPREFNEWGHTFEDLYSVEVNNIFVGVENGLDPNSQDFKYIDIDDMIAYFNNYDKNEHYFATKEQYQGKGTSIYIVDPEGANQVKENVKDAEVVTIFLMADERIRLDRMYFNRVINDAIDRAKKDREIFKTCKCDYVVDANREVEEVLSDVVEIIGK